MVNLIEQLKSVKLEPRREWKDSTREILLSQVKAQAIAQKSGMVETVRQWAVALYPEQAMWRVTAAIVLITSVVSTFSIGASKAAQSSLPGDWFYPVKITAEKVQMSFTADNGKKAELALSFAKKRIEEVKQIKEVVKKEQPQKEIVQAATLYKEHINAANASLEKLNAEGKADETVRVAVLIETQTTEHAALIATTLNAPVTTTSESGEITTTVAPSDYTDLAKMVTDEAEKLNEKAVELIVDKYQTGQVVLVEGEVKDKVNNKITQVEESVTKGLEELDKVVADIKELDTETKKSAVIEVPTPAVAPAAETPVVAPTTTNTNINVNTSEVANNNFNTNSSAPVIVNTNEATTSTSETATPVESTAVLPTETTVVMKVNDVAPETKKLADEIHALLLDTKKMLDDGKLKEALENLKLVRTKLEQVNIINNRVEELIARLSEESQWKEDSSTK